MAVITLSRHMGSWGTEMANEVAKRRGLQYVDRQIIFEAAKRAGVPEAALAEVDEFGILQTMLEPSERRMFTSTVEAVIQDFAKNDNVIIVGRGGQVILNEWPRTLHLQVIAPLDARVDWLVQKQGIDRTTALNRIQASDKARGAYLRRNYNVNWLDSQLYDLVINTGKIQHEHGVELIVRAMESVSPSRS